MQTRAPAYSGAPFFQLAVRHSGRARRSAGSACTGAGATCTDSAGARGASGRRGADRAAGILRRRRSTSIWLVLITNNIATHVPALVGSRASRSRACSGSLCICYPGDCRERSASNRREIDFVHGVSSLVDRQECRQISMRRVKPRSVKFSNRTPGRGNSGKITRGIYRYVERRLCGCADISPQRSLTPIASASPVPPPGTRRLILRLKAKPRKHLKTTISWSR